MVVDFRVSDGVEDFGCEIEEREEQAEGECGEEGPAAVEAIALVGGCCDISRVAGGN